MVILAIGAALLACAVILAPLTYRSVRRLHLRHAVATLQPRAVAARTGQVLTVTGIAVAGPDGAAESRLARADCVWHGHEVLRHYWSLPQSGASGGKERKRECDPIADYASAEPFGIAAPGRRTGHTVLVDPKNAEFSGVGMCLQRVVGRPQQGVPAPADDLLARVKGRISGVFRGETIEFEYREWVVRPGAPITVHATVELRHGRPVLVPPPGGRLRVEHGGEAAAPEADPERARAILLGGSAMVAVCLGLLLTLSAV